MIEGDYTFEHSNPKSILTNECACVCAGIVKAGGVGSGPTEQWLAIANKQSNAGVICVQRQSGRAKHDVVRSMHTDFCIQIGNVDLKNISDNFHAIENKLSP